MSTIRPVTAADLPALRAVIDATGLFPSELLDGMAAPHLAGEAPDEIWLTADSGAPQAIAYCAPERMTSGTWNLYLIAVHPDRQGQGHGAAVLRHLEGLLAARGGRVLLVETSGLPDFARTRGFYLTRGFEQEARIRDFYAAGEDKLVFRKALRPPAA
jgi:ribosomal protein S18 acetylase RimI-like enzyme